MNSKTQTADEIIAQYKKQFKFLDGFESVNYVMDELQRKDYRRLIKYPYQEMNKVLRGIFPTSFVVIGADYGGGKSDLMGDIALSACSQGKRVLYFDFENDDGDFVMRQICKRVSRESGEIFTVADLRMTDIENDKRSDLIFECSAALADEIKEMRVYKNDIIPNINEFVDRLGDIKDFDLICIDHLHYFEYEAGDNVSEQISRIMRELRRITKIERIPVVLVSHLTKRDKNKLPTGSDFHGSSNIAKEAKTAILLHRGEDYNTMVIDKNRDGGSRAELVYNYDPLFSGIKFIKNDNTKAPGF